MLSKSDLLSSFWISANTVLTLNLLTEACDASTARERKLPLYMCFGHCEQLEPNISLQMLSSIGKKLKGWSCFQERCRVLTHGQKTKTYDLVSILQLKTQKKTTRVGFAQHEAANQFQPQWSGQGTLRVTTFLHTNSHQNQVAFWTN